MSKLVKKIKKMIKEKNVIWKCPHCGCMESWFDRTIDEDGMLHERCSGCGKSIE